MASSADTGISPVVVGLGRTGLPLTASAAVAGAIPVVVGLGRIGIQMAAAGAAAEAGAIPVVRPGRAANST